MMNLTDRKDCICPACKQPTDFDARFCKHCAFDLNQPTDAPDALTGIKHRLIKNKLLVAALAGGVLLVGIALLNVFLSGGMSSNARQTGGSESSAISAVSNGDSLSEAEMVDLMKSHGIWNAMDGWHKYDNYEILRVGPFNKEGKYYPVRVKITGIIGNIYSQAHIWDCRIQKNDYGDWEVRKMGL